MPRRLPVLAPLALLAASAALPAAAKHVSVYYYPWYAGANWDGTRYLRGSRIMDIPPLIGTYDNATNSIPVRQHVEWSTNFGIDNWIASWWGPGMYQSNAILKNVMPNLAGTKVTFCLFYETSSFYNGRWTFGDAEIQLFHDHIKHMHENYFPHPNYWKIGGRPVVVVYLSRQMQGRYAEALEKARKDFNVFLVGDDFHFGPPDAARHKNWDAITIYNIHGLRAYDGYPQATGFVDGARQNFRRHKAAIASSGTRFMSNAIPGYNDRAVRLAADNYPIPRRVHADSAEGSTFAQLLDMALAEGDSTLGTAICSWNEWFEDSQIEPTVVSPARSSDGSGDDRYSKGYSYEGYGATLLKHILAKAGRNADVAPTLQIQEPAGQNSWAVGSRYTIQWTHTGTIYYVNVEYAIATGWKRIATQLPNTGSHPWTVERDAILPARIRVTTVEGVTESVSGTVSVGAVKPADRRLRPRVFRVPGGRAFAAGPEAVDGLWFDAGGRRLSP